MPEITETFTLPEQYRSIKLHTSDTIQEGHSTRNNSLECCAFRHKLIDGKHVFKWSHSFDVLRCKSSQVSSHRLEFFKNLIT